MVLAHRACRRLGPTSEKEDCRSIKWSARPVAPGVVAGALTERVFRIRRSAKFTTILHPFPCTTSTHHLSSYTFKDNGLEFDQRPGPSEAEYTCIMPGTEAILVLVCQPRASLYYTTLAAEDRLTLARMPRRVLVDASFASFAPSGLKAEDAPSQSEIRSGCHIPHGFQGVQNLVTLAG